MITYGVSQPEEHLRPGHDGGHPVGPDLHQDAEDGAPRGRVRHAVEEPAGEKKPGSFENRLAVL